MGFVRLRSLNIMTIAIVLILVLLLVLLALKAFNLWIFNDDERFKNVTVTKPDEIYIAKDGVLARVDAESRWYKKFWLLADDAVKADTGSNVPENLPAIDVSSTGFLRGYDTQFTPSILGFKRLKAGKTTKLTDKRQFILLLYNKPKKLVVSKDKAAESHMQEVSALGYPINEKGIHWVRYILFEKDSIAQDYNLFVEGVSPYWNPSTNISSVGTGYHRQFVDKNKFDLDKSLDAVISSYGRWWPW